MNADGRILMRDEWHEDPLNPSSGYITRTPIAWEGGPIATISWDMVARICHGGTGPAVGEYIFIGPWLCEVVALGGFRSRAIYVTRNFAWAWWYAFRFRLLQRWLPFKGRVLATCAVWGLARYDWGAEPSWSEIYAVAWLKAKVETMTNNRTNRLPVVTALLDAKMRDWLNGASETGPSRKAEGVAQTDDEIEQIMSAISASVAFRVLVFKMEWDTLKRAVRTVATAIREVRQ